MGDLVKRTLRKKPHLRIVKHRKSLDFIFTYEESFPRALREENPRLYRCLFASRKKGDWVNILLKAYSSPSSTGKGQKKVRLSLRFWLNRLLLNALDILASNAMGRGHKYKGNIKEEVESFKGFLRRKPGPHKSLRRKERDAIQFAKRYEELKPQAKKLKAFVKEQNNHDEKALGQAAERVLRFKWLPYVTRGEAFQHLPTINNDPETTSSTLNGKWAPWRLSVGILYCCEESIQNSKKHLGPNTIYKYVQRGNKLLRKKAPGK